MTVPSRLACDANPPQVSQQKDFSTTLDAADHGSSSPDTANFRHASAKSVGEVSARALSVASCQFPVPSCHFPVGGYAITGYW